MPSIEQAPAFEAAELTAEALAEAQQDLGSESLEASGVNEPEARYTVDTGEIDPDLHKFNPQQFRALRRAAKIASDAEVAETEIADTEVSDTTHESAAAAKNVVGYDHLFSDTNYNGGSVEEARMPESDDDRLKRLRRQQDETQAALDRIGRPEMN